MNRWFVVQTNAREDKLAVMGLQQKGIEVYQPQMQRYVFHARKKILKNYPLFPGYIFVCTDDSEISLHQVKWCRGVGRVLPDNSQPVPVPDEFVSGLMGLESEDGVITKPVDYQPGDLVKVKSGPMKDVYGIFEAWGSDDDRVRILIDLVGNQAKVMMHPSMLEKA